MSHIETTTITLITAPHLTPEAVLAAVNRAQLACQFRAFEVGTAEPLTLTPEAASAALNTAHSVVLQAADGHLTLLQPAPRADEVTALFLEDPSLWCMALGVTLNLAHTPARLPNAAD